jgi:hypothetical protein
MKQSRFRWLWVLSCPLLLGVAFASGAAPDGVPTVIKSQPDSPLQVISLNCKGKDSINCSATIKNASGVDISAYGLTWHFVSGNGTGFLDHTTADRMLVPPPKPLHPSDTDVEQSAASVSTPNLARVEVEVDFVIPALGQPWGNTKMSSLPYQKILATRAGYGMAMEHLRTVYSKSGMAGVQRELATK